MKKFLFIMLLAIMFVGCKKESTPEEDMGPVYIQLVDVNEQPISPVVYIK